MLRATTIVRMGLPAGCVFNTCGMLTLTAAGPCGALPGLERRTAPHCPGDSQAGAGHAACPHAPQLMCLPASRLATTFYSVYSTPRERPFDFELAFMLLCVPFDHVACVEPGLSIFNDSDIGGSQLMDWLTAMQVSGSTAWQ